MDKTKILDGLVASVVKHFNEKGFDLSEASDNDSVQISTSDILKLIKATCQIAVSSIEKGEGNDDKSEDADQKKDEEKKKEKEKENTEDKKEEDKKEDGGKGDGNKETEKITKALEDFSKILKNFSANVEGMKEAGRAKSTQKDEIEKKKDASVFKGIFS